MDDSFIHFCICNAFRIRPSTGKAYFLMLLEYDKSCDCGYEKNMFQYLMRLALMKSENQAAKEPTAQAVPSALPSVTPIHIRPVRPRPTSTKMSREQSQFSISSRISPVSETPLKTPAKTPVPAPRSSKLVNEEIIDYKIYPLKDWRTWNLPVTADTDTFWLDRISRFLFPIFYFIFTCIYWTTCLNLDLSKYPDDVTVYE